MAYSSSIPPFYSNNTSSPFYSSYISPFYPSYTTNTPPSPNEFYPIEASRPNLSFTHEYSPPSSYYNLYGSEGYSSYSSNYPIFDGKDDAYGWILCTEEYFRTRRTSDVDKMFVAAMAMRGEALKWWLLWSKCHPEVGWEDFTTHFLWQFKPEYHEILPILEEEQSESQLKKDSEELVEEEKEELTTKVEPPIVQEELAARDCQEKLDEEPVDRLEETETDSDVPIYGKEEEPDLEDEEQAHSELKSFLEIQESETRSQPSILSPFALDFSSSPSASNIVTRIDEFFSCVPPLTPPPKPPYCTFTYSHSPPVDAISILEFHHQKQSGPSDRICLEPVINDLSSQPLTTTQAIAISAMDPQPHDLLPSPNFQSPPFIQITLCVMNPFLSFTPGHISAFERYTPLSNMCDSGYHRYNNHLHTPFFVSSHAPFPTFPTHFHFYFQPLSPHTASYVFHVPNHVLQIKGVDIIIGSLILLCTLDMTVASGSHFDKWKCKSLFLSSTTSHSNLPSLEICINNLTALSTYYSYLFLREYYDIGIFKHETWKAPIEAYVATSKRENSPLVIQSKQWDPGRKLLVFTVANCSRSKQWDSGGYFDEFTVVNSPQIKQWDLGDNLWFLFTMAWSCQFKLWDPGKSLIISIFLQP